MFPMKSFWIAAAMAGMMIGAAPAVASPAGGTPGISAPQDMRDGRRDDRRMDRRDDRRWGNNGRHHGWDRGRHNGWGNRWCHNVRRHHRWVRVCGRR